MAADTASRTMAVVMVMVARAFRSASAVAAVIGDKKARSDAGFFLRADDAASIGAFCEEADPYRRIP